MLRVLSGPILILGLSTMMALAQDEGLESTVITSKRLTYDYKRSIAIFQGDVVVTDPRLRMTADEMRVFFAPDNSIRCVTALGNVQFSQGPKKGSCQRAVYLAKARTVDLMGRARVEQDGHVITGDLISINLEREEMVCEPGHAVIIPSQDGKGPGTGMRFLP